MTYTKVPLSIFQSYALSTMLAISCPSISSKPNVRLILSSSEEKKNLIIESLISVDGSKMHNKIFSM